MMKLARTEARGARWHWAVIPLLLLLVLSGCANGIRLYDEPRSKLATGIKEGYANASVLSTIEVEKKNLDRLLEEELKVVRDNQQLRVDFALLRIADDSTPMAVTYTEKVIPRLTDLGYGKTVKDARARLLSHVAVTVRTQRLTQFENFIRAAAGVTPPPCTVAGTLPDTLTIPPTVSPENRRQALGFYRIYRDACTQRLAVEPTLPDGLAAQALAAWRSALAEVAALDRTLAEAQKDVEQKTDAHRKAEEEATATANLSEDEKKKLQDKAAEAAKALQDATSLKGLIEGKETAKIRVKALVDLLTAAAGGTVDTSKDAKLAPAVKVAAEIPSLKGDLKELVARGRGTPSVNNLLIELRHQVVLLERIRQLRSFAQQRADLAHAQYDAIRTEAELWVRFSDAMCGLAFSAAGKDWPGQKCDYFEIRPAQPAAASPAQPTATSRKFACIVEDEDPKLAPEQKPPTDCVLVTHRWNEVIRSPGNDPSTRELYKGLAAYLQALAAEGTRHELTFRMIDVRHRETLVARDSALRAWDNLVAVPIEQLDAYYRAGLKPAEIADLIVKALGFAAIAFGVSQ